MARLAKSLVVLRGQLDVLAPDRSKKSDGWIGDPAHASRPSRHNPNDAGVVCALDITDDPANGCPIHDIARIVVCDPPIDLEYVISNAMVAKRKNGFRWEHYRGQNPHVKHAHFAVGRGPEHEPTQPYDGEALWHITAETPEPVPTPPEDDMPVPPFTLWILGDDPTVWKVPADEEYRQAVPDTHDEHLKAQLKRFGCVDWVEPRRTKPGEDDYVAIAALPVR